MATAAEVQLEALRTAINGGNLYLFAGPVPADETVALDMVVDHTQLVKMTDGDDGVTGLDFSAPVGDVMASDGTQDWLGLIAFDGAEDGESSLDATFYRFCPAGDDGRGAASGPRLQGTVGGPVSGAKLILTGGATLTANGVNKQGVSLFTVSLTD
ncbi:MAG TPA: hypothetical protein VGK41_01110 [Solirubrobacterales bacterium]